MDVKLEELEKKDLLKIANDLGIEGLNNRSTKETIINAIVSREE